MAKTPPKPTKRVPPMPGKPGGLGRPAETPGRRPVVPGRNPTPGVPRKPVVPGKYVK